MAPQPPSHGSLAEARPTSRTPSIYEVARRAEVSVATVSRVLNGKGPVRAATRERVLEVVGELGYVPHGGARSLSTRRTMLLGVVLPDMHGEFFSELVRGIDRTARAAGYHLLVSGAHDDPDETAAVLQALHGRVDGLILMAPGFGSAGLRERPRRLPLVLLSAGGGADGAGVISIRIDNRRGAGLAVECLIGAGHRDIAFIGGPEGNSDAAERLRGYEDALRRHRLQPQRRLEIAGDFSEQSGVAAGTVLARLRPRPTAVFAANDAMAVGCLSAFGEAGLEVPRDVSLVGFDDIPIARHLSPPLTTVRVPIAALGQQATSRLLQAIEGAPANAADPAEIAPTLAVRGSVGPPPSVSRSPLERRKSR
jgi:LacI family transcriptional regulator